MSAPIKLDKTEDKEQVIGVFQPLLSKTFGGENYQKYYLNDAKQLVRSHVNAELKRRNMSLDAVRKCQEIKRQIDKSKSINKMLEHLTEACLLDEELID